MILTLIALAAATPAAADPTDPKQKVRCVREEMIGSLVRTRKVCHTLAEWEAISRQRADNARDIVRPDGQMSQTNGGG